MATKFALTGPQGIGKTRAATRIAQALGLTRIVDDWIPDDGGAADGSLIVANDVPGPHVEGWEDVVEIRVASAEGMNALVTALERTSDCGCGHGHVRKPYAKECTPCCCGRTPGCTANSTPFKLSDWLDSDPLPAAESRHPRLQAREWLASLPAKKVSRFSWLRIAVHANALPTMAHPSVWTWLRLEARALRLELLSVLQTGFSRISRP